jgi:hypothetical protein
MKNIKTQKIYTYPDRNLYGEFCLLSLLELKVKIVKGEIKEQLCYIDENDRAYIFDEFANPEGRTKKYIETQMSNLLRELVTEQIKIHQTKIK